LELPRRGGAPQKDSSDGNEEKPRKRRRYPQGKKKIQLRPGTLGQFSQKKTTITKKSRKKSLPSSLMGGGGVRKEKGVEEKRVLKCRSKKSHISRKKTTLRRGEGVAPLSTKKKKHEGRGDYTDGKKTSPAGGNFAGRLWLNKGGGKKRRFMVKAGGGGVWRS